MSIEQKQALKQAVCTALSQEPFEMAGPSGLSHLAQLVRAAEILLSDVELHPERVLYDWNILFLKNGEARFAGTEDPRCHDAGVISSPIVGFDPFRRIGRTASGRVYRLEGAPLSWRMSRAWTVLRVLPGEMAQYAMGTMTDPNLQFRDVLPVRRSAGMGEEPIRHVSSWQKGDFCLTAYGAFLEMARPWLGEEVGAEDN